MKNVKKETPEVFYSRDAIARVDGTTIQWLKEEALSNQGKSRLCVHKSVDDQAIHEMIIVHTNDAYVPPHKHIGKTESVHVIEGAVDVIFFDEQGGMTEVLSLGEHASGQCFFYRIPEQVYHTLLIRSDLVVFHETTDGPFRRNSTVYASWAPNGLDPKSSREYMTELDKKIGTATL